ncbi:hypothetical protein ACJJTC_011558 [Scirpophaga incertulas]
MGILNTILVLTVLLAVNNASARRSTPLIKNVHSGGIHFEGPHWSVAENALYWVDISGQRVYRMDGETGEVTFRQVAYGPVSLVVTVKNYPNIILLTVRSEVYLMDWNASPGDAALRQLSAVDVGLPDNRCNDGKVDAKGRLWFGTIGREVDSVLTEDMASLYLLDKNNFRQPEVKVRPVSVSNGLAWTKDNKFMFYIDTPTRNIDVFDFELDTGILHNRRTLFSFQANNVTGLPDGMTIDTDDNLWVACYNGGKVIKIDSRAGKLLEQHTLQVSKVSSVMFGGHDLSTLYVTTSKRDLTAAEIAQQPEAGSLFAIEGTGSKGRAEHQFVFPGADTY